MNPKVSVIVPCYNAEKTIHECLESLIRQTLKDIEIIVINDGSTDGTKEILEAYAKECPKIRVYHQADLGQANAMNRGLYLANGEYIAECDSDDYVSLNCYETLYKASEGKADVVRCGWFGNHKNGFLEPILPIKEPTYWNKPICPRELTDPEKIAIFGRMCLIPAGIYKRTFIKNNELLWRENKNFEDTALSFKIRATANDYRYCPAVLYYYRRGNDGSGTATIKDDEAIFEQYAEMRRYDWEHRYGLLGTINTDSFAKYMWALSRAQDKAKFLERCEFEFKTHGALPYQMSESQWAKYCIIKSGAWKDLTKKFDFSWFYAN